MLKINCATINKVSPHIYLIKHKDRMRIEISDAKEINDAFEKIVTEKYFYAIIDARSQFNSFSKHAFNYLAKEAPVIKKDMLKGVALIVESLPNRMLANFFKNFYTPPYPFKIFKSQAEATKWLANLIP